MDLCWQSDVSAFNTLSRFVIAFLPRSRCLWISCLQSLSAVILETRKIKSVTVSTFSPSVCHGVMGLDVMIFVFWMLSFKPAFSLSFDPHQGTLVPLHFLLEKMNLSSVSWQLLKFWLFKCLMYLFFLANLCSSQAKLRFSLFLVRAFACFSFFCWPFGCSVSISQMCTESTVKWELSGQMLKSDQNQMLPFQSAFLVYRNNTPKNSMMAFLLNSFNQSLEAWLLENRKRSLRPAGKEGVSPAVSAASASAAAVTWRVGPPLSHWGVHSALGLCLDVEIWGMAPVLEVGVFDVFKSRFRIVFAHFYA